MRLEKNEAGNLIQLFQGDHIHIPRGLVKKVGDLETAAFVSLAAFLSSTMQRDDGWFFLEQEGDEEESEEKSFFKRWGSWQAALGLGKAAQVRARRRLEEKGLLANVPSARARRQGGQEFKPPSAHSFLWVQARGAPPRLFYRVDMVKYLHWLSSSNS